MDYESLSTFGKILYASYKAGKTALATAQKALTMGKITLEEFNFITGVSA